MHMTAIRDDHHESIISMAYLLRVAVIISTVADPMISDVIISTIASIAIRVLSVLGVWGSKISHITFLISNIPNRNGISRLI